MGNVIPDRFFWALAPEEGDRPKGRPTAASADDKPQRIPAMSTDDPTGTRSGACSPARSNHPRRRRSPVRAFRAVGGTPRFIRRAEGAYLWDADGRRYIDYIGSWGPMILGHGHPAVLEAVTKAAATACLRRADRARDRAGRGNPSGWCPASEQVRLVSSGTEAGDERDPPRRAAPPGATSSSSSRAATTAMPTRCSVKAGSGLATFGNPTSAGVPPEVVQHTLVLGTTTSRQLEEAFAMHGPEVPA